MRRWSWVIWVCSIRLLSHLNTEPFLCLNAAEGNIRDERWGRHLSPVVGYSCRPKWKAEVEEGIQAALDSKDEVEVTQEEKRVLWVWGAEAPQQPESSRSLPHGSIENSSLADSFCLIMAPEAEGGSPPRKQHPQKPFLCMNLFLGVYTYIHVHACTCGCHRLHWWPSSVSFYFLLWDRVPRWTWRL